MPRMMRRAMQRMMRALRLVDSLLGRLAILAVRGYQRAISPWLPPVCRFTPSCSQYMIDAIRKKGFVVGAAKGLARLARCNPFFPGGHDPVH